MPFSNPIVGTEVLVREAIESEGFETGVTGWRLEKTGDAEFNDVTVRGEVEVGTPPNAVVRLDTNVDGAGFIEFVPATGAEALESGFISGSNINSPRLDLYGPTATDHAGPGQPGFTLAGRNDTQAISIWSFFADKYIFGGLPVGADPIFTFGGDITVNATLTVRHVSVLTDIVCADMRPQQDEDSASRSTTVTTYSTGVGGASNPEIHVRRPTSGRIRVVIQCISYHSTASNPVYSSFRVDNSDGTTIGTNILAASDSRKMIHRTPSTGSGYSASYEYIADVSAGTDTHVAVRYACRVDAGTGNWNDRVLIVEPLM